MGRLPVGVLADESILATDSVGHGARSEVGDGRRQIAWAVPADLRDLPAGQHGRLTARDGAKDALICVEHHL